MHCRGPHFRRRCHKSGPAFWATALGRDHSGHDMWHLEKRPHVPLCFSQRFPRPNTSGRKVAPDVWVEVGKKTGMWLPSLELGGPVELARPSQAQARERATRPRVSPQADNLSGVAGSSKGARSEEVQPKSQWSPGIVHSTPTDTNEVSVRDSSFQPSLCLCPPCSLFSNVLPPLPVCLFWFCSPFKAHILCRDF